MTSCFKVLMPNYCSFKTGVGNHLNLIPLKQRWRGYSNAAVCLWLGEWVGAWVCPCVHESVCPSHFALWTRYRLQFLPDHFHTSYVSCSWWEEEPYWFWVMGSRVKVKFGSLSIKPFGMVPTKRYRLQFLPNHFQTSHVSCSWWEEEPYWFWVTGSKVKVKFGTLSIKPCGQDTDYSFCPFTFKLHM